MDKKIKQEQRSLVEGIRNKILDLKSQQDLLFGELINELNITSEYDKEWIFNFIYNTSELSDQYYEVITDVIFE